MLTYPIPMVPGPVRVPPAVLAAYQTAYGSADLEDEFFRLYADTEARLKPILGTSHPVVLQTGEGMLALWSALKSCLVPGDRVLAVATGVFGYGIGEMARALGCEVRTLGLPHDQTLDDLTALEETLRAFKPKMITAVHCETPSGTLNPIAALGRLKEQLQIPLLYVDAVASAGGTPVEADAWGIDLCLCASQKCLSAPADMAFLSVSPRAWEVIAAVGYAGYDALEPFRTALKDRYFPYTPNWQGVAALHAAAGLLLEEGLAESFARHERVATYCRQALVRLGLELFPAPSAVPSPTVTAVKLPAGASWPAFDTALRRRGLVVAGSYGPLVGKVFRLGHMGSQADLTLMESAVEVIAEVV
ncbi:MAG: aminotransferase class V-fold PLP-dependent enzyme [Desulfobacterales bacterium]